MYEVFNREIENHGQSSTCFGIDWNRVRVADDGSIEIRPPPHSPENSMIFQSIRCLCSYIVEKRDMALGVHRLFLRATFEMLMTYAFKNPKVSALIDEQREKRKEFFSQDLSSKMIGFLGDIDIGSCGMLRCGRHINLPVYGDIPCGHTLKWNRSSILEHFLEHLRGGPGCDPRSKTLHSASVTLSDCMWLIDGGRVLSVDKKLESMLIEAMSRLLAEVRDVNLSITSFWTLYIGGLPIQGS